MLDSNNFVADKMNNDQFMLRTEQTINIVTMWFFNRFFSVRCFVSEKRCFPSLSSFDVLFRDVNSKSDALQNGMQKEVLSRTL